MPAQLNRLPNGNVDIKITLPWTEIQKAYEAQVDHAVTDAEIPGFRKGKAPKNLILPKLDHNKLYSEAIQSLLPDAYSGAVKEHHLKPLLYPHLHIDSSENGKDWEFTATTCETPEVSLKNYQDVIKQVAKDPQDTLLSRILDSLKKSTSITIPDILVEEESNHRLSDLAENITKLGLSIDGYLQSKKLSLEDLKAQTATQSRNDLETEFILDFIRTSEKLENRSKTLDFLISLV